MTFSYQIAVQLLQLYWLGSGTHAICFLTCVTEKTYPLN